MSIVIQEISLKDLADLRSISITTFTETFASVNTEENMNNYILTSLSTDKLKAELTNVQSKFFFALDQERVIGYLKINLGESQTDVKDSSSLEIERIYVLSEYHGKKVGQLLFDHAIKLATQMKLMYVWLGVWEKNVKAINFYQKNGFVEFDKHLFKLGDDIQTDIMMKLQLC